MYKVKAYNSAGQEIYNGESENHSADDARNILCGQCGVNESIDCQQDKGAVNCWSYECQTEKESFTVEFK